MMTAKMHSSPNSLLRLHPEQHDDTIAKDKSFACQSVLLSSNSEIKGSEFDGLDTVKEELPGRSQFSSNSSIPHFNFPCRPGSKSHQFLITGMLCLAVTANAQSTGSSTSSAPTATATSSPTLTVGSKNTRLQIVIPIVAGVVILAIVAMMIFIKCASNRQNKKRGRKRRVKAGAQVEGAEFEYEGVPA